jgi:hypothetical protein
MVSERDGGTGAYCIPGVALAMTTTLCGAVDVAYTEHDHPVTCRGCLAVLDYCKKLRVQRAADGEVKP